MNKELYNINIERAVLSSIIFEPSIFDEVNSKIKSNYFYLPAHQRFFKAMETLHSEDLPIDEEFIKKKIDDSEFDETALLDIISTYPLSNTKAYVDEILELHTKRELVTLTTEIRKVTIEEDMPSEEAVDLIQQKLYQITSESTSKDFRDGEDITAATLAQIHRNKEIGNKGVTGLDTGFIGLNGLTKGFGKGDMIIIAARPAMGKTAFVLSLAGNVINHGQGVAFFSLEMPAEQLMMRMLSAKTSIPLQNLKIGDMTDEQWKRLSDASDFYANSKLFVDDDGQLTIAKLRSKLRDLKSKHPEVELAIIDYIQLMSGNSNKDRHLEVSEISRGIKLLARELDMPIIALSQLNRGLESRPDKRPMLSDIRESGSIEQDADIIMFVYRDDVYLEREERQKEKKAKEDGKEYKSTYKSRAVEDAEIILGKHRNGPIGTIEMQFHKGYTRFNDVTKTEVVKETTFGETNIPMTIEKQVQSPGDDNENKVEMTPI